MGGGGYRQAGIGCEREWGGEREREKDRGQSERERESGGVMEAVRERERFD